MSEEKPKFVFDPTLDPETVQRKLFETTEALDHIEQTLDEKLISFLGHEDGEWVAGASIPKDLGVKVIDIIQNARDMGVSRMYFTIEMMWNLREYCNSTLHWLDTEFSLEDARELDTIQ